MRLTEMSVTTQPHTVLIRCDGSARLGLGHVVRCLALADVLAVEHACRVEFLMLEAEVGIARVRARGFSVHTPPPRGGDYEDWFLSRVRRAQADLVVLDVRDDLPRHAVTALRREGVVVATIDDPSDRRLDADLAFYPPVPQVERVSWQGFTGELYAGWDWIILRRQFAETRKSTPTPRHSHTPTLLVTMGGSDPAGLTLKAVQALELVDEPFTPLLVLGPAFCDREPLDRLLAGCRHRYEIRESVEDMAGLMFGMHMAIASFCITAYELAAMGVPGIYLSLSPDHAESASVFAREGIGRSLGVHDEVSPEQIAQDVVALLGDAPRREKMSRRARALVDDRGAQRVAAKMMARVEQRHVRS